MTNPKKPEGVIASEIRQGFPYLWRNNSGALTDRRGRLVRYGLGNESAAINSRFKTPDLVGFHPVKIEQHHIGTTFAVFLGVEVKPYPMDISRLTTHEAAQHRFLAMVENNGGLGCFASSYREVWDYVHSRVRQAD